MTEKFGQIKPDNKKSGVTKTEKGEKKEVDKKGEKSEKKGIPFEQMSDMGC